MTVRSLETVHRLRYFRFCNVLHIWTIRAIPTYRVYRLYDTAQNITNVIILCTCIMYSTRLYDVTQPIPEFEGTSQKMSDTVCEGGVVSDRDVEATEGVGWSS